MSLDFSGGLFQRGIQFDNDGAIEMAGFGASGIRKKDVKNQYENDFTSGSHLYDVPAGRSFFSIYVRVSLRGTGNATLTLFDDKDVIVWRGFVDGVNGDTVEFSPATPYRLKSRWYFRGDRSISADYSLYGWEAKG